MSDNTTRDPDLKGAVDAAQEYVEERAIAHAEMPPHPLVEVWLYFRENKGALLGLGISVAIVLMAIFAGVLAPHSPISQDQTAFLLPPAWLPGGSWTYPLGTDAVGRDLLSRLIYGSRLSLFVGLLVVTLSLLVGVLLGLISGYFRGYRCETRRCHRGIGSAARHGHP